MEIAEIIKNQNFFKKLEEKTLSNSLLFYCEDDKTSEVTLILTALMLNYKTYALMNENSAEYKRVLNGADLDIKIYPKNKEKLLVSDSNEIVDEVFIKPTNKENKVFIIENIDLSTTEAQNKLLKVLEEPPAGVTIFLGVANEAGVLDTVKSRCRKVYIDVFDRETVYNALKDLGCGGEEAAIAAACCEGQLGKARVIAFSPEYGERYADALTLLERLKRSRDVLDAESVPSLKSNEGEFLKVLAVAVRDIISAKEGSPLFFGEATASRIERLSQGFSLRALALTLEAIGKAQEKLAFSVNTAAVEDSLLFDILEVKHKWQS